MAALIELSHVSKDYVTGPEVVHALRDVSLSVGEGELVAVVGQSGSGKSTLMNILGCLDRPTAGRYLLAGKDVSGLNKVQLAGLRNRQIGFIFQSFNLLPRTSALRNVMLPLVYQRQNRLSQADRLDRALAALEAVGLADRASHEPNELSGGQRQRVAIARALVNDPLLIMADEPTGNLDTRTGDEIMGLLHELHRRGRTILMVTHEQYIARQTERIITLVDGKVATDAAQAAPAGQESA